eukprot:s1314_g13.t1
MTELTPKSPRTTEKFSLKDKSAVSRTRIIRQRCCVRSRKAPPDFQPLTRMRYSSATLLFLEHMMKGKCGVDARRRRPSRHSLTRDVFARNGVINDDQAYTGIVVLISFLIVFRTQTGYHKRAPQSFVQNQHSSLSLRGLFLRGVASQQFRPRLEDLSDGCSDLIAYCEGSKLEDEEVQAFQHLLIRLASLLSAVCFAELMGGGIAYEDPTVPTKFMEYELIDFGGLDDDTRQFMLDGQGSPEIIYQWIQIAICRANNMGTFGVPPPVLTRAYQDLGLSMIRFHQAQKIVEVPFPLPYVVALQLLLITHWVMTPIVCSGWTDYTAWAVMFALTNTLSLWFFVGVAMEMDSPFKQAMFAIDSKALQRHLNHRLMAQLHTFEGPQPSLKKTFTKDPVPVVMTPQETGLEVGRVRSNSRPPVGNYRRTGSLHGALTNFCMDGPLEYDDHSDDAASPQDVKLCLPDEKIRLLRSLRRASAEANFPAMGLHFRDVLLPFADEEPEKSLEEKFSDFTTVLPWLSAEIDACGCTLHVDAETPPSHASLKQVKFVVEFLKVVKASATPQIAADAAVLSKALQGAIDGGKCSEEIPEAGCVRVVEAALRLSESKSIETNPTKAIESIAGRWEAVWSGAFTPLQKWGIPPQCLWLEAGLRVLTRYCGQAEELNTSSCAGGLPLALFGAYLWTSCAGDLVPAASCHILAQMEVVQKGVYLAVGLC